ncbi:MAG TPA: alpha/beta fold hydrolase, partial [Solirubrobacterales bacterium]|nr:alpha/beta fold hydrolase [Solirubrobacterales bacterium]
FKSEPLGQRLSYWPIIGQAANRLAEVAPKSLIRSQYDQAFAPGYDISSGFDNPDQPVDDLRAMTYTAYKNTVDEEKNFVDEQPLDQRLAATHVPLQVIFGAEDQIYDAQEAVDRYRRNVPGAQTHLIPGAGHSPNVEKPGLVAPLILAFAKPANAPTASKKTVAAEKRAQGQGK